MTWLRTELDLAKYQTTSYSFSYSTLQFIFPSHISLKPHVISVQSTKRGYTRSWISHPILKVLAPNQLTMMQDRQESAGEPSGTPDSGSASSY